MKKKRRALALASGVVDATAAALSPSTSPQLPLPRPSPSSPAPAAALSPSLLPLPPLRGRFWEADDGEELGEAPPLRQSKLFLPVGASSSGQLSPARPTLEDFVLSALAGRPAVGRSARRRSFAPGGQGSRFLPGSNGVAVDPPASATFRRHAAPNPVGIGSGVLGPPAAPQFLGRPPSSSVAFRGPWAPRRRRVHSVSPVSPSPPTP